MLKRVVTATALTCLMFGAAFAAEEGVGAAPGAEDPCIQQLAAAEEAVATRQESAPLSDEEFAKVNELLDQADAQCTEGKLPEATATLTTVKGLIGR
jgi:hypothetical protein